MKFLLTLFFWLVFVHASALAQTDQQVIKDDKIKISFQVPDGWTATKRGDGYVLGSTETKGFMLIEEQRFDSLRKLKIAMEAGIAQADGAKLMPSGKLTMLGEQGVSGMYDGTIDGVEMTGFLMALMPPSKGRAVICISVAPKTLFNQSNIDQLKILLRSVIFNK